MFLKIFLISFTCFSADAMDFDGFYPFLLDSHTNSPTNSPTIRKSVKKDDENYKDLEEAKGELEEAKEENIILYTDRAGFPCVLYVERTSASAQPEESLAELSQSLKISKILYKSHAIANTFRNAPQKLDQRLREFFA